MTWLGKLLGISASHKTLRNICRHLKGNCDISGSKIEKKYSASALSLQQLQFHFVGEELQSSIGQTLVMLLSELAEFPVECHVMFVISIILDSRKSNWLAFTTDIQILRSLMKSGTKLPLFVFSLECLADVTKGFNSFLGFFFFFFQLKNRIFPLETNKYLYLSCLWCPKREDEKSHQTLLN